MLIQAKQCQFKQKNVDSSKTMSIQAKKNVDSSKTMSIQAKKKC